MLRLIKDSDGHMETATPAVMLALVLGIAAYGIAPGWARTALWVAAGVFGLIGLVMIVSGANQSPFAANFEAELKKERKEADKPQDEDQPPSGS